MFSARSLVTVVGALDATAQLGHGVRRERAVDAGAQRRLLVLCQRGGRAE